MPALVTPAWADSLALPPWMYPHQIDLYGNQPVTRDASGEPVDNWILLYASVPALVATAALGEPEAFFQRYGVKFSHTILVGQLPGGALPVVGRAGRVTFGLRPDGVTARTFDVARSEDDMELGVVRVIWANEVGTT